MTTENLSLRDALEQEVAVTIACLLAGRIDGQQAVASTVAQVERILTERDVLMRGESS